jgi:hypothetical protein
VCDFIDSNSRVRHESNAHETVSEKTIVEPDFFREIGFLEFGLKENRLAAVPFRNPKFRKTSGFSDPDTYRDVAAYPPDARRDSRQWSFGPLEVTTGCRAESSAAVGDPPAEDSDRFSQVSG